MRSYRRTGTSCRSEQWNAVRQALGNQRLLGLDLASGGHLTHGYRLNSSGKMFEAHGYTVDRQTFLLDYDAIEKQALEVKPLILLAGFSAIRATSITPECGRSPTASARS